MAGLEGDERRLQRARAAGGYLAISQGTGDFSPARASAAVRGYDEATAPFVVRSRERVMAFFDGLTLVEPGVVQLPYWRPDAEVRGGEAAKIWLYAGVGRKE